MVVRVAVEYNRLFSATNRGIYDGIDGGITRRNLCTAELVVEENLENSTMSEIKGLT